MKKLIREQSQEVDNNFDNHSIIENMTSQISESNRQIKKDCENIKKSIQKYIDWKKQVFPLQSQLIGKSNGFLIYTKSEY